MSTINIGTGRSVKTLEAALSAYQSNDTLVLDPEVFTLGGSAGIYKPCTIKSADGGTATIKWHNIDTSKPQRDYTAITVKAKVLFENIKFDVRRCWALTCNKLATGTILRRPTFTMVGQASGLQCLAAQDITVEDAVADACNDYTFYGGGDGSVRGVCRNIRILRPMLYGSHHHVVRFQMTHGLLVEGPGIIDNSWDRYDNYHGGALNLRHGSDFTVKNMTVLGSIGFGPRPEDSSGIRLEKVRLLNTRQYGSFLALEAGTSDVLVDGYELWADQSGNAINVKSKPNTPDVQGVVRNSKLHYKGGVLCKNKVPSLVFEPSVTFDESLVPPIQAPEPTEFYDRREVDTQLAAWGKTANFKAYKCT